MIFSDIWIANSGRAINNNGYVVGTSICRPSGNYIHGSTGINDVIKPSGYGGNVTVSILAHRFDDYGYEEVAHSGRLYGNVLRDTRQTYN